DGALPPPDVIYVALGSAGTVAGLTFALWGDRAPEIVGVKVVDSIVATAGAAAGGRRISRARLRSRVAGVGGGGGPGGARGPTARSDLHRQGDGRAPRRRAQRPPRRQARLVPAHVQHRR